MTSILTINRQINTALYDSNVTINYTVFNVFIRILAIKTITKVQPHPHNQKIIECVQYVITAHYIMLQPYP